MSRLFLSIVSFLSVFLFCSSELYSQWVSDSTKNTPVCTANGSQQNPLVVSDGNNGAIVVWQDYRNNNWDVFAQHLDAGGVAQWASNGIAVCTSTANQSSPIIASDGSGGVYIVWKDSRRGGTDIDLYGQHVKSDGSLAYGATGSAICAVAPDAAQPTNLAMCSDGQGNAFVAWEDSRTSTPANSRSDIYMNRLTANSVSWGGSGAAKITAINKQGEPALTDDGNGGCVLVWVNHSTTPSSVRAAQISSSGNVGWASDGVLVYKDQLSTNIVQNTRIARDGSQFMIAFEVLDGSDATNGWDLYAQRLKSDGTLVWNTTASAPQISRRWFGDQTNSTIFSDEVVGTNSISGLLVVYENNGTKKSIVMTRLLSDGDSFQPGWPNHIFTVCNVNTGDQTAPVAVRIGSGELMVAWVDKRAITYTSIYGQRVDRTPARYLGPSAANSSWSEAISNHKNSDADQVALVARTNGAIAVWRDNRNGNTDIYAQLIFKDGSLPIELSSFDLKALTNGEVLINWETANEKDNAGFEIERRKLSADASNTFEVIASYRNDGSLRGSSFSNTTKYYTHVDQPTEAGTYEYRLVDYTLDGERTAHAPKIVEDSYLGLDPGTRKWNVSQNFPNPFQELTSVKLEVPQKAIINVEVFDGLGRKITTPISNVLMEAGFYYLDINAAALNTSTELYYYTLTASDPETGAIIWRTPKAMMMQVIK